MSLVRTEIDLGAKLEIRSSGVELVARLSSERAKWLGKREVVVKGRSIREALEKIEVELGAAARGEAQSSLGFEA